MLEKIENLPSSVIGIRAQGQVTRRDYEKVLNPLLKEAAQNDRKIRFLYHLGPEFSGLTAGAALEDFRMGITRLRLFEKCAIVSDVEWLIRAAKFFGSVLPCPVKTFKNSMFNSAVEWLTTPEFESKLQYELKDSGVLLLHPHEPLRKADFDKLASVVDPWIENHHELRGVVVGTEKFPGWENIGSFIDHISFVKNHHRKVRRVAVAMDGNLAGIMGKLAAHFIDAEIRQFPFDQESEAIAWASH